MIKIISVAGWVIVAVLVIDALCFMAWIASGQYPADSFYAGAITAQVLGYIIH